MSDQIATYHCRECGASCPVDGFCAAHPSAIVETCISSAPVEAVQSIEYVAKPQDSRCKYWCKIIRAADAVPMPSSVNGANDIPGQYLRKGDDVEIFPGDFVLEGEEVHHVKKRGWCYKMTRLDSGKLERCLFGAPVKDAVRSAGRKDLLGGSGDVAAMVRTIHARRAGIWPVKAALPEAPAVCVCGPLASVCHSGMCSSCEKPAPEALPNCASTRGLECDCPGVVCLVGSR